MKTKTYKLREVIARHIYKRLCNVSDNTKVYFSKAGSETEYSCFVVCGCMCGHDIDLFKKECSNVVDNLGICLNAQIYKYELYWKDENAVLLWDKTKEEKWKASHFERKKKVFGNYETFTNYEMAVFCEHLVDRMIKNKLI